MYRKLLAYLSGFKLSPHNSTPSAYPRWITIQVEDDKEQSGYIRYPALLIGANTAAYITNEELELHYVKATDDPQLYDYFASASPVIYVGADEETAYQELTALTAGEFFSKYPCYSQEGCMAKYWHELTAERQGG